MKILVTCAIRLSGGSVLRHFARRRQGDLASCKAELRKARGESGADARRDPDTMMADVWRRQQGSPAGCN